MNKISLPLFLGALLIICAGAEGADWNLLGKSNLGTVSYDKYGIKQLSENVVSVSVKIDYSSEGVKEVREAFPFIDDSQSISYTLYTYEVKCYANSFRIIKAATYNSSGNTIKGTDLDYVKTGQALWTHTTPGSMLALLSEESCKYLLYDR
jgi:hypothetical protein